MRADLEGLGRGARRVDESTEHVQVASALLGAGSVSGGMFGGIPSAADAAARLETVRSDHAAGLDDHRRALSDIASNADTTATVVGETDHNSAGSIAGADG